MSIDYLGKFSSRFCSDGEDAENEIKSCENLLEALYSKEEIENKFDALFVENAWFRLLVLKYVKIDKELQSCCEDLDEIDNNPDDLGVERL